MRSKGTKKYLQTRFASRSMNGWLVRDRVRIWVSKDGLTVETYYNEGKNTRRMKRLMPE